TNALSSLVELQEALTRTAINTTAHIFIKFDLVSFTLSNFTGSQLGVFIGLPALSSTRLYLGVSTYSTTVAVCVAVYKQQGRFTRVGDQTS
ncbi:MAG: hypothetical protein ABGX65_02015, partial [Acidimicrobiales bacterium]